MPAFDTSTPRINLKVADIAITAPAPYVAGYVLSDLDAKFFNRQVATAVGNPIPAAIKAIKAAAVEAGQPEPDITAEALQAEFDKRYAAYEPGASNRGAGAGAEPTDPVAVFTRQLAEKELNKQIRDKGRKITDVKAAKVAGTDVSVYVTLRNQLIERDPSFKARAEAMVAAMGETTTSVELDTDLLDGVIRNEAANPDTTGQDEPTPA